MKGVCLKISILGTVGVPGRYGGFETLAENLVRYHQRSGCTDTLTIYGSARAYPDRPPRYLSAQMRYYRLRANGAQSVLYDAVTLVDAALRGSDVALLLGVSGAVMLPLVRLFTRMRIVTNVDGIEWRRDKWRGLSKQFLRLSEWAAVRFSHQIVADNQGIANYLHDTYGIEASVIEYGGDHALEIENVNTTHAGSQVLPEGYALAICRIEPENNVAMILEASAAAGMPLVFVGNWNNSVYGRKLRSHYGATVGFCLLDPIYNSDELYRVRAWAKIYVHGHSAGGTNPSLVEMMHFGLPILAFDCIYNRYTTENLAYYFTSTEDLTKLLTNSMNFTHGIKMREIAQRRYCWAKIGKAYFELLGSKSMNQRAMPGLG